MNSDLTSTCFEHDSLVSQVSPVSQVSSSGPRKVYYSYNQIHSLIQRKSDLLKGENFDYIIAIGGGGLIPARILRTYLNVPIIVVTVNFYDSDDMLNAEPKVIQWDSDTIESLIGKRCLIVDEVLESGTSMKFVIEKLKNSGLEYLSAMVLHHKNIEKNIESMKIIHKNVMNYYALIEVSKEWIVYPWEADDIEIHDEQCHHY